MASGTVDVYVKIPTGRTAQYYVRPSDTIGTLCRKVAEEEKVKETQVRLKYQGKVLNTTHSMTYLGVRPETILKAEILVPRPVTLIVTLPNDLGETEVTSSNLDAVSDVTAKIADVIKEDKSRVVLKYAGRQVRGLTLLDAGLVDGSSVEAQLADPPAKKTSADTTGASPKPDAKDLDEEDEQAILTSFETGGRPVEVVFSFDTTGSMYSCLDLVRTKLRECCTRLIQDIPNIRIGIIAHGDYCDESNPYVISCLDLTSDVQALVDFVRDVPKTSGGDCPECYEWVLRKAQGLDWSEESAKALVVIGDATPHPPEYTDAGVFWKDELSILTGMGIKVYGVRALNQKASVPFYQELADVSGGHYLTMNNFDVITDMFLAVCYREANEEDLGEFEREVEAEGRMTEERRQIFDSLHTQNPTRSQQDPSHRRPEREVTESWWERSRYQGNPQYHYDPQRDRWSPFSGHCRHSGSPPAVSGTTTTTTTTRGRRTSKKCSIM
ncbi:uncharacterized protein LOC143282368 [Babylonia areolata]|uniref:uncharacterized protein LOC143282368 n=1 Tax=Babylonia areolata TaxID=304850 RepID=UPI003FD28C96